MKFIKFTITTCVVLALAACVSPTVTTTTVNGVTTTKTSYGPIADLAHADLLNAASIATANGYPARAAVYIALDTQLTACEQAMAAAAPKPMSNGGQAGLFTLAEIAAETVGNGIPAAVKLNCSAIQLPLP